MSSCQIYMYSDFYKENDIQSDYVYMCLYEANG